MGNVYADTKAGALDFYKKKIQEAGAIVPRMHVLAPYSPSQFSFKEINEVRNLFHRFQSLSDSPYAPGIMIRDNGTPQGTGGGASSMLPICSDADIIRSRMRESQGSNSNASVILQLPVGQPLHFVDNNIFYSPIFGAIAYTSPATQAGNAVVEWAPGHTALAVKGFGKYVAFNKDENSLFRQMVFTKQQSNWPLVDKETEIDIIYGHGQEINICPMWLYAIARRSLEKLSSAGSEIQEKVSNFVLRMGEEGALYFELAATHINGKTSLFCFQVAEVKEKLSGIPTWMHDALNDIDEIGSGVSKGKSSSETAHFERLKSLYREAVSNPSIIVAGSDVVGSKTKSLAKMLWKPTSRSERKSDVSTIFINHDGGLQYLSRVIANGELKAGGLVELIPRRVSGTFKAHMHGACESQDVLGIGNLNNKAKNMEHKLVGLLPGNLSESERKGMVSTGNIILKGDFTMQVDQTIPFGTVTVNRIDSVEQLPD